MKKVLCLVALFLLVGCQKDGSIPKLKAKNITLTYGEDSKMTLEQFLDLSDFTDEQIQELNLNGDFDHHTFEMDQENHLRPGKYKVVISYYDDVVESTVTVVDPNLPVFNEVNEVDVPWSYRYFNFLDVINASSPIGLPITITIDDSDVNFYEFGKYPLHVTATDGEGRKTIKVIVVNIV